MQQAEDVGRARYSDVELSLVFHVQHPNERLREREDDNASINNPFYFGSNVLPIDMMADGSTFLQHSFRLSSLRILLLESAQYLLNTSGIMILERIIST